MKKLSFTILLFVFAMVFHSCEKQSDPTAEYTFPINVISADFKDAKAGNRVYYLMNVNTGEAFLDDNYIQSIDEGPFKNGYEGITILEKYDDTDENEYRVEVWYETDIKSYTGDVYIKFIFQDTKGRRSTSSTVTARFFE